MQPEGRTTFSLPPGPCHFLSNPHTPFLNPYISLLTAFCCHSTPTTHAHDSCMLPVRCVAETPETEAHETKAFPPSTRHSHGPEVRSRVNAPASADPFTTPQPTRLLPFTPQSGRPQLPPASRSGTRPKLVDLETWDTQGRSTTRMRRAVRHTEPLSERSRDGRPSSVLRV